MYLTDVRIADADRIGDIGEGWRVSMTTLMNERTTIGGASGGSTSGGGDKKSKSRRASALSASRFASPLKGLPQNRLGGTACAVRQITPSDPSKLRWAPDIQSEVDP